MNQTIYLYNSNIEIIKIRCIVLFMDRTQYDLLKKLDYQMNSGVVYFELQLDRAIVEAEDLLESIVSRKIQTETRPEQTCIAITS